MATLRVITGVKELDANLVLLQTKIASRVAMSALRAGVAVLAKAQRKAAPVGATGQLKRSIGSRVRKLPRGGYEAKAGVNVGKQTVKRKGRLAPHAHLVALGTKNRFKKSGASTGTMPANPFIRTSFAAARGPAIAAMKSKATSVLQKETAKLKK